MAGRHYNNNLLDEASNFNYRNPFPNAGTGGYQSGFDSVTGNYYGSKYKGNYLGNNAEEYILGGGDPFMAPDVLKMHYGVDNRGLPMSTQYINEIPGFTPPLTQFGNTMAMFGQEGFNYVKNDIFGKDNIIRAAKDSFLPYQAYKLANWVKGVDWTEPHNFLPALGMGADYVVPGLGIPFDWMDGRLYQKEGDDVMAGLAYGSALLPYSLTMGKKVGGGMLDMATGHANTGQYLKAGTSNLLNNTSLKSQNILRGGKPLVDDMSTTAKASLDDISKLEDDFAMPRFEGELDPMFIGNPNIRMHDMSNLPKNLDEAYNLGYQQTIGFKTGPEAFMRFKHTYPELASQFKNVGEFDAFIKESLEDLTQEGRVQFYDTPFTRSTPWGEGRASGTHYPAGIGQYTDASTYGQHRMTTDVGQDILDPRLGNNLSHIGVSTVGRNTEQIASTLGHELHHGLTTKIWKENFKLTDDYKAFLKSDDYLQHVEKVKHMPDQFREGYLKHQQDKYINSLYFKSRQPGPWSQDYLMNQARGPGIADLPPETGYPRGIGDIRAQNVEYGNAFGWDTPGGLELSRNIDATTELWKKRYNYMNRSDEVAARAHEIRMMDDMAKARSMEYYSHPWGTYGQDILDYHPDFFKKTDLGYGKSIFDMMYGMAPVGLGLGAMRGVNLLDYASEE